MREIQLEGAGNIRDFGGTKTKDGRTVKPGLFIRGSALDKLTDADIKKLSEDLHIKTVIDLRTPRELSERPDKRIPGADYLHLSILDESVYGISHEKAFEDPDIVRKVPDMEKLYRDISRNDYAIEALRQVFNAVTSQKEGAVYWHCKEGKDRCGIVSALFLLLLGVPEETVMEDYLATNRWVRKKAAKVYIGSLIKFRRFSTAKKIYGIFVAKKEYLLAALTSFKEVNGSMDAFFTGTLGLSDEKIKYMKENYLE